MSAHLPVPGGRPSLRHRMWRAAGWTLLGFGAVLLVMPLVSFGGLGFVALAGPLLLAGFLVLVGSWWARWLGLIVLAANMVAVWYVISSPLRGLHTATGPTEPIDPAALAAGAALTVVALVIGVLLLVGRRQARR
jgi:hypothetical protein